MRLESLFRETILCLASALGWLFILPLTPLLFSVYALWQKAVAAAGRRLVGPTGRAVLSNEGLIFNLR